MSDARRGASRRRCSSSGRRVHRLAPRRPLIAEGESVDVVDDLSTGSLGNLADARAEAGRLDASELHIHTLDAAGDDLAALIAMRRPREIYHLALLPRSTASAVALGRSFTSMLGVLDAARRSRRHEGRRRAAGDRAVRASVGSRAAGEGGGAAAARRARRGRQGDRRPADGVPRGVGDRVHGAGPGHRLRPAPATRRRRRGGHGGRGRRRRGASRSPATGARPATSSSSTTSSTPSCAPAGGAAGWSSTSAPACRRRCATCGRCVAPDGAPADVRRRPPRRARALRRVAGAGPHPPRLVAVDHARRGSRRAPIALTDRRRQPRSSVSGRRRASAGRARRRRRASTSPTARRRRASRPPRRPRPARRRRGR